MPRSARWHDLHTKGELTGYINTGWDGGDNLGTILPKIPDWKLLKWRLHILVVLVFSSHRRYSDAWNIILFILIVFKEEVDFLYTLFCPSPWTTESVRIKQNKRVDTVQDGHHQ